MKEFSKWLEHSMRETNASKANIVRVLKINYRTINGHLSGEKKPTFCMVVAYCWYFNSKDNPEDIWNLVEGDGFRNSREK